MPGVPALPAATTAAAVVAIVLCAMLLARALTRRNAKRCEDDDSDEANTTPAPRGRRRRCRTLSGGHVRRSMSPLTDTAYTDTSHADTSRSDRSRSPSPAHTSSGDSCADEPPRRHHAAPYGTGRAGGKQNTPALLGPAAGGHTTGVGGEALADTAQGLQLLGTVTAADMRVIRRMGGALPELCGTT